MRLNVAVRAVECITIPCILAFVLTSCGPRYIASDSNKIDAGDGVLVVLAETNYPTELTMMRADPPYLGGSETLEFWKGRNSRMISVPAGNYRWARLCVDGRCSELRGVEGQAKFRIDRGSINYVGNLNIRIYPVEPKSPYPSFVISVFDAADEAKLFVAGYPQLASSHPFVINMSTDRLFDPSLHREDWVRYRIHMH